MKSLWLIMIMIIVVILAIFIYAGIFYPLQETPRLVDDVDTESLSKRKEQQDAFLDDVVIFAFQRNRPEEFEKIVLQNNGMKDLEKLENELYKEDYIAVLSALWSEQDPDRRLMWLQEKQKESHPILLLELAVETMKKNPDLKNFKEALFLLELGKFRTDLDAVCISDSSASSAGQSLYTIYAAALAKEVQGNPGLVKELVEASHNEVNRDVLDQLLSALKRTKLELNNLPPPDWVSSHALQKLFIKKNIILAPKQCKLKREELIDAYVSEIEEGLKEYAPTNYMHK